MWLRAVAGIGGAAYLGVVGVIFNGGLGFLDDDTAGIVCCASVYGFNLGGSIFAPCDIST